MGALYDVVADIKELQEMATELELDAQTISDTLEMLNMEFEDKADNCAKAIRYLEGIVKALEVEIKRLQERKTIITNNIIRIKKSLEKAMCDTGNKKFKTLLFSYNVQKNAPSLDILDETKIPKKYYVKQDPVLDKKSLLVDAKVKNVKGVSVKQTESLRIR